MDFSSRMTGQKVRYLMYKTKFQNREEELSHWLGRINSSYFVVQITDRSTCVVSSLKNNFSRKLLRLYWKHNKIPRSTCRQKRQGFYIRTSFACLMSKTEEEQENKRRIRVFYLCSQDTGLTFVVHRVPRRFRKFAWDVWCGWWIYNCE